MFKTTISFSGPDERWEAYSDYIIDAYPSGDADFDPEACEMIRSYTYFMLKMKI